MFSNYFNNSLNKEKKTGKKFSILEKKEIKNI